MHPNPRPSSLSPPATWCTRPGRPPAPGPDRLQRRHPGRLAPTAQATVTAKEKALTEAEAAATTAAGGFCTTSTTYVTAIDRYGDALNATAPTVGDVRMPASDLAQPGEDAQEAASAVAETRTAAATAEQELAQAQAALAAAQASAAGTTPLLRTVQRGPQPDADAGGRHPRAGGPGRARGRAGGDHRPDAAGPGRRAVQRRGRGPRDGLAPAHRGQRVPHRRPTGRRRPRPWARSPRPSSRPLADAGYYDGKVDGIYGPGTVTAVQALQKANGLPQTGTLDKATEQALRSELAAKGGAAAQEETGIDRRAVQQTLKLAGYWDGPVDGRGPTSSRPRSSRCRRISVSRSPAPLTRRPSRPWRRPSPNWSGPFTEPIGHRQPQPTNQLTSRSADTAAAGLLYREGAGCYQLLATDDYIARPRAPPSPLSSPVQRMP